MGQAALLYFGDHRLSNIEIGPTFKAPRQPRPIGHDRLHPLEPPLQESVQLFPARRLRRVAGEYEDRPGQDRRLHGIQGGEHPFLGLAADDRIRRQARVTALSMADRPCI